MKNYITTFIAHAGVCSRRQAIELVRSGRVTINHYPCTDPSRVLAANETVRIDGAPVEPETKRVYIMLNKPDGCICACSSPFEEKTVLDYVPAAREYRIYPVGRLDKNSTGLLLLTNDGAWAQKLAHPSFNIAKEYVARLDRQLSYEDFGRIIKGVRLDDGFIKPDFIRRTTKRTEILVRIHSGKKHIVRRLFKHFGYNVLELKRSAFGSLRLDVKPGQWRYLKSEEVANIAQEENVLKRPPLKRERTVQRRIS